MCIFHVLQALALGSLPCRLQTPRNCKQSLSQHPWKYLQLRSLSQKILMHTDALALSQGANDQMSPRLWLEWVRAFPRGKKAVVTRRNATSTKAKKCDCDEDTDCWHGKSCFVALSTFSSEKTIGDLLLDCLWSIWCERASFAPKYTNPPLRVQSALACSWEAPSQMKLQLGMGFFQLHDHLVYMFLENR